MKPFLWMILILIGAVLIFLLLDYIVKRFKKPQTVQQSVMNAIYFIQLKQYQVALDLLAQMEAELAITPEEMCDVCIQRADAHKGLAQYNQAVDAYEILYEALQESERPIKRNDALLSELKECYQKAEREEDFKKWDALFASKEETE